MNLLSPAAAATSSAQALKGQAGATQSAGTASRARLPSEVVQQILSDDALSKRDLLQFRSASRWSKVVVDESRLEPFRLPTATVGPSELARPTTATYLQTKAEASARAIAGRFTRLEFDVGRADMLLVGQPNVFLLRCGNGRLLAADLFSEAGLFAEVAPAGTMASDDYLLTAALGHSSEETWRVVAESGSSRTRRVYTCRADGSVRCQLLPSLQTAPAFRTVLEIDRFVFSSENEY